MKKMKFLLTAIVVVGMSNVTSAQWSLTGNASTTPGTNYVGTSDNQDLVIKTNAAERIRVGSAGAATFGLGNDYLGSSVPRLLVQNRQGTSGMYSLGVNASFLLNNTAGTSAFKVNINENFPAVGSGFINGSIYTGSAWKTVFSVSTSGLLYLGDHSLFSLPGAGGYSMYTQYGLNVGFTSSTGNMLNIPGGYAVIGNVTTPAGYKLYVESGILTEKVKVAVKSTGNWSDYVFDKNYKLRSLGEVESYIKKNKHLPGVPSAEEVVKEGIDMAMMDAKLLEKIEELTLYMIEMKKENEGMKKEIEILKNK